MTTRIFRTCLSIALIVALSNLCAAVDATFVLDQQRSSITIEASTVLVLPLRDSDTKQLTGTIDTTLDFGTSGTFPATADITVNDATISPVNPFSLTLGLPPGFGVDIDITGVVAKLSTPSPPATLTMLPTGLVRYQFDAADFLITLNQGTVEVSGAASQTIDLGSMPVTGSAPIGTFGQITFLDIQANGPFTEIDALLELPIMFTETIDSNSQSVDLEVTGDIVATSSFSVALNSADLNGDGDVDGADFLAIQRNSPLLLAQWELEYGLSPSVFTKLQAVPEPSAAFLLLSSLLAIFTINRHRRC